VVAARAISCATCSGSCTWQSSRRSTASGVRPAGEICRIRRVIAARVTPARPARVVPWLSCCSSARTVARSCSSDTVEGSVPAPTSASRSSRWVSGSVTVNGARKQVTRKPCRTSSVSMPATLDRSAAKFAASVSTRAPNRTGAAAAFRARTAALYRTCTRPRPDGDSSRPPRRTARLVNATSTRSNRSGCACNRSMTSASHCVSTRTTGRWAQPHRTPAVPPTITGATPANSPNGVGRPSARSR